MNVKHICSENPCGKCYKELYIGEQTALARLQEQSKADREATIRKDRELSKSNAEWKEIIITWQVRAEKAESELSSLRKERDEAVESAATHEMNWFTEKKRADHFQKLLQAIGYITSNTELFQEK